MFPQAATAECNRMTAIVFTQRSRLGSPPSTPPETGTETETQGRS